jgi:hypothetical protein
MFVYDPYLLIIFRCYTALFSVPCATIWLAAPKHENITQLALCISISCHTAYYVSQRCHKGCVLETPQPGGPSSRHSDVLHANQTLVQASAVRSIGSRTCNMKYCRMSIQKHHESFLMLHLIQIYQPMES